MQGADEEETKRFLTNLTSVGSKIIGGTAGYVATAVTGVPLAGLIVSPFVAYQMEKAGKHLIESRIAPRQEMRVAAAYVLAYQRISERQAAGEQPRQDGFFSEDGSSRSAAEEITEATLVAARDAAEEKKIPFIANLLAAIVYDAGIDRSTAQFLTVTSERLSYRSFIILATIGSGALRLDVVTNTLICSNIVKDAILSETFDMYTNGFVEAKESAAAENSIAMLGSGDIEPNKLYLTELGQALYDALDLRAVPDLEPERVIVREAFNQVSSAKANPAGINGGKF